MNNSRNHNNMFDYYGDKISVYEAFKQDADKIARYQSLWYMAFGVLVALTMYFFGKPEVILFGGAAAYALHRANVCFVENSNRNWAMHVIDWFAESQNRTDGEHK